MGGLRIANVPPAPRYEFEMLHAETDELFLHFKVSRHATGVTAQSATDSVKTTQVYAVRGFEGNFH